MNAELRMPNRSPAWFDKLTDQEIDLTGKSEN